MLILLVYFLFASTFTLGKAVLSYCNPILFIGVRMSLAGFILLVIASIKNQWSVINRDNRALFFQIIIFHIYCAYVFEFWALNYMTSSKTALIYNISPFITAFLSYIVLDDRLNKMTYKKWVGLGIGMLGMVSWLISHASGPETKLMSFWFVSWPELSLLFAVTSAAYGWIVMHMLLAKHEGSPLFINGYGMLGGGLLALATSLVVEGKPYLKVPQVYSSWIHQYLAVTFGLYYASWILFLLYLVLLIIIANGICYNLYGALLRRYSATLLSFAGFTCPLFAAVLGWFFHGEAITYHFLITLVIIFFGLYIFYQEELNPNQIQKK